MPFQKVAALDDVVPTIGPAPDPADRRSAGGMRAASVRLPGLAVLLATTILSAAASPVMAQSAAPGATVLETITIRTDDASRGLTPRERIARLPGGASYVGSETYDQSGTATVSRALAGVPGVVVQEFFGGNDQPRIQIRGSGLQQNPVERGILMLQDGLPINRADGSYIVGLANPQTAAAMEIYRGYLANRLGASVSGGAMNFISPTGRSQPGASITLRGGSFGQVGAKARAGFESGPVDGHVQLDLARRDGFRTYNRSQRVGVGFNAGYVFSPEVQTRIFAGYTDLQFDVAGPLTKAALKADPRQVSAGPVVTPAGAINPGPNVQRDKPERKARQFLVGTRTSAEFDAQLFDLALGYTYTDDTFRFPVSSGVRQTRGGDVTAVARYAYAPDQDARLPLVEATAQVTAGEAQRRYFLNNAGKTGAMFGKSDLTSSTLSASLGLNLPVTDTITVSPAIAGAFAHRENRDRYGQATRPTLAFNPARPGMALPAGAVPAVSSSYSRDYAGFTPSLGASWQLDDQNLLFAAISRSFEPPTHDDLLSTVNGTPNSSAGRPNPANPGLRAAVFATPDLKAQTATTIEGGWRGEFGQVSSEISAYYALYDDELLSLRDETGASLGAMNAGRTRHVGVDANLTARLTDQITGRIAYTFQDFRFVDDRLRGNNRLGGAPAHILSLGLDYQPIEGLSVGAALKWVPTRTPVDNMNTLYADPYALVDVNASYKLTERVSLFGEVTNVFDQKYASSTLIVDQARADQAAFLPGDGRAFYLGLKASF